MCSGCKWLRGGLGLGGPTVEVVFPPHPWTLTIPVYVSNVHGYPMRFLARAKTVARARRWAHLYSVPRESSEASLTK